MVSVTGIGKSQVDHDLATLGKQREVVMHVPSFTVAMEVCEQTSLACILPMRLLAHRDHHLKLFKPPFQMPKLIVYLYWHARLHQDPATQWLHRQWLGTE